MSLITSTASMRHPSPTSERLSNFTLMWWALGKPPAGSSSALQANISCTSLSDLNKTDQPFNPGPGETANKPGNSPSLNYCGESVGLVTVI